MAAHADIDHDVLAHGLEVHVGPAARAIDARILIHGPLPQAWFYVAVAHEQPQLAGVQEHAIAQGAGIHADLPVKGINDVLHEGGPIAGARAVHGPAIQAHVKNAQDGREIVGQA